MVGNVRLNTRRVTLEFLSIGGVAVCSRTFDSLCACGEWLDMFGNSMVSYVVHIPVNSKDSD